MIVTIFEDGKQIDVFRLNARAGEAKATTRKDKATGEIHVDVAVVTEEGEFSTSTRSATQLQAEQQA